MHLNIRFLKGDPLPISPGPWISSPGTPGGDPRTTRGCYRSVLSIRKCFDLSHLFLEFPRVLFLRKCMCFVTTIITACNLANRMLQLQTMTNLVAFCFKSWVCFAERNFWPTSSSMTEGSLCSWHGNTEKIEWERVSGVSSSRHCHWICHGTGWLLPWV